MIPLISISGDAKHCRMRCIISKEFESPKDFVDFNLLHARGYDSLMEIDTMFRIVRPCFEFGDHTHVIIEKEYPWVCPELTCNVPIKVVDRYGWIKSVWLWSVRCGKNSYKSLREYLSR